MADIHQILSKYWNFNTFRPLQEEIIRSVLHGNDTLALLPTGGGKSICFQIPALAREGVCIVVSPLIALMKDQVENLNKKGIKAVAVYSGMTTAEIDIAVDNCIYGNIKFLYLSPERLTTDMLRQRIPKMKVSLVAIDEAHCISQWGYDFRPPYLRIAEIRELLPDTPFLALTATATTEVIDDICDKLALRNPNIFRKSFERKNLTYAVVKEEDKTRRLLTICQKIAGTGIVYVRNRKKTREIAEFLNKNNIRAEYYHAGLDARLRDRKQQLWMNEKCRVIVSTNAFGMGIDKPNVRFVAHMDLPDCPEAYFQEAGRAGRDEKKAYAILLYNASDILDMERNFEQSYPSISNIKAIYNSLGNYFQLAMGSGKDKSFDFVLSEFCNHYHQNQITVFNSLKFLEREGYLMMSEALAHPSRIHIFLNKEELYRFMVATPYFESLIKLLLRSYSGLFSDFVKISESDIANRLQSTPADISKNLQKLHQMKVLYYNAQNEHPRITFTLPRIEISQIVISPENYKQRKEYAYKRLLAMKDYITAQNRCRSIILLNYFGEHDRERCGSCDICRQRNKLHVTDHDFNRTVACIKPLLQNHPCSLEELIGQINTGISETHKIDIVRWLIDQQMIVNDLQNGTLQWVEP